MCGNYIQRLGVIATNPYYGADCDAALLCHSLIKQDEIEQNMFSVHPVIFF